MGPSGEGFNQTEAAKTKDMEAGKQEPRRLIHFSSGETMEEYSTDEEFEEEQKVLETVNPSTLPWNQFLLFWMMKFARTSLSTCDFLGGKLANLFGLTSAKYQYAIDEYYSVQDQEGYEDGDEMTMEEVQMHEKQHLPIQNSQYGTLNMVEQSGVDRKHTVSYDNEALEDNGDITDQIKMDSN